MTTASVAAGEIIETVDRLIDVLDSEVDLLSAMRASEIGRFQPTKTMLIDSYERLVAGLRADEAALAAIAPADRKVLCECMARLTHACRRNENALKAVAAANERLMRAIVDEVRRQKSDTAAYTGGGAVAANGNVTPLSVRIDERL